MHNQFFLHSLSTFLLVLISFSTFQLRAMVAVASPAAAIVRDGEGVTALHRVDNTTEIDRLLNLRIDVNDLDNQGRSPLHWAAWYGKKDIVQHLIIKGANVNARANDGTTPLHLAVHEGKLDVIRLFFPAEKEVDVNINAEAADGRTPLHMAAQYGHKGAIEFLLKEGADITAKDKQNRTPLDYAKGYPEITSLLDISKHKEGATALHHAVLDVNLVKRLISHKANVNSLDIRGLTPLHWAVYSGAKEVAEILITHGANINAQAIDGRIPLHIAAERGHEDVIKLLLKEGADITAKDKQNQTPLDYAKGHPEITSLLDISKHKEGATALHDAVLDVNLVKRLISHKANVNILDIRGLTPLHWAAYCGAKEVAEILITHGANINTQAIDGRIPLHIAAERGHEDVIKLLLKEGADITAKDKQNRTPLDYAKGYPEITSLLDISKHKEGATALHHAVLDVNLVKRLISHKANVNSLDIRGLTPLHWAVYSGAKEVAEILITHGANINAQAIDGRIPLHIAAERGHEDVIKLLLKEGADITAKDKQNQTPLDYAKGHPVTVTSLLDINSEYNEAKKAKIEADRRVKEETDRAREKEEADKRVREKEEADRATALAAIQSKAQREGACCTGRTPLHIAASEGNLIAVKTILAQNDNLETQNASLDAKDSNGWTPLQTAINSGNVETANFLKSRRDTLCSSTSIGLMIIEPTEWLSRLNQLNSATNSNVVPLHEDKWNAHLDAIKRL